jgi:hypothetical protein
MTDNEERFALADLKARRAEFLAHRETVGKAQRAAHRRKYRRDRRHHTAIMRFLLNIRVDENGCWRWQKKVDGQGFGCFEISNQMFTPHRYAYEFFIGDSPKELTHTCKVKDCVNPLHLMHLIRKHL